MRTDIHSPKNIIPENYEPVSVYSRPDSGGYVDDLTPDVSVSLSKHMLETGGEFAQHKGSGQCHVCGSSFIDYATFYHVPSNEYINAGLDCSSKIKANLEESFRRVASLRRAKNKKLTSEKKIFDQLEDEESLLNLLETYYPNGLNSPNLSHKMNRKELITAIVGDSLDNYGNDVVSQKLEIISSIINETISRHSSLSPNQINFLIKLEKNISEEKEKCFLREEERSVAEDVPEGKHLLVGEILSRKTCQDFRGNVVPKMLFKDDRGFKVFVTIPSKFSDVKIGDRLEFVVNLKPSDTDSKFAFGSRPSKMKIL